MEERVSAGRPLGRTDVPDPTRVVKKTMDNDRQTKEIRSHVRGIFLQHGASQEDPIQEAILIRDGFYCGRRFQCGELQAVWFVEEDQLKIYNQEGVVQKTTVSVILQQPHQKAA